MLRRVLIFSALLLSAASFAQYRQSPYGELYDSEGVAAMRRTVEYLSAASMEGRAAGSEGEAAAAAFVTEAISKSGVDVLSGKEGEIFGMKLPDGDTLVSRNVVGFIPGYDSALKEHYIVIGARLDGPGTRTVNIDGNPVEKILPGANGNASGVAMLLNLAKMLQANSVMLRRSVLIVAFGASSRMQAGSWYFLNRSFPDPDKIDAMINIDMVGTGSSGFYAWCASNPALGRTVQALAETLQPVKPELVTLEPVASDHRSFYDKGIPSILFTTGMYREYESEHDTASIIEYDWMERVLEYVHNYAVSLINGPKPAFNPADELAKEEEDKVIPYYECDWKPSFLGSTDPKVFLQKWVYVYLRYPESCVQEGVQGRVLVDFVIDEKGRVRNVRVLKGVDPRLDAEAVRAISASPDWKPARLRGKKVKSGMSLYVEFRLEKKKKKK